MDKSLTDAANAAASGNHSPSFRALTITASWEDVLAKGLDFNFRLLNDLCKMKEAGHRVIITATTDKDVIADMMTLATQFGAEKGYDLRTLNTFEFIGKLDLMRLSANNQIQIDIALDSEDIATQSTLVRYGQDVFRQQLHYAAPRLELHVGHNFATSPVSMEDLPSYVAGLANGKVSTLTPTPAF